MIRAGIIEGTGYRAGELIRLLLNHPDVELMWVTGSASPHKPVAAVHRGLTGDTDLTFADEPDLGKVNVVFVCQRGHEAELDAALASRDDLRVIDLTDDNRLSANADGAEGPVYGLPESNRKMLVRGARSAVCPGPLAMALELSLLPLAKNLLLNGDIHSTAICGSSDAGESLNEDSHSTRADNVIASALLAHDDIPEVHRLLSSIQASFGGRVHLVGLSGSFPRGLMTVTYLDCPVAIEELTRIYEEYYDDHNFTYVSAVMPDLKDVVNTNKCLLHLCKSGSQLVIVAVTDNLLKGSAGTAVHIMNLLFGLHERTGLNLKASAY